MITLALEPKRKKSMIQMLETLENLARAHNQILNPDAADAMCDQHSAELYSFESLTAITEAFADATWEMAWAAIFQAGFEDRQLRLQIDRAKRAIKPPRKRKVAKPTGDAEPTIQAAPAA